MSGWRFLHLWLTDRDDFFRAPRAWRGGPRVKIWRGSESRFGRYAAGRYGASTPGRQCQSGRSRFSTSAERLAVKFAGHLWHGGGYLVLKFGGDRSFGLGEIVSAVAAHRRARCATGLLSNLRPRSAPQPPLPPHTHIPVCSWALGLVFRPSPRF